MELLPESRDEQFRTFGLFIDNQTSFLYMPTVNNMDNNSNIWLALGGSFALAELHDWYGSPQLLVYASVNAGDRLKAGGTTILMETIDIRAGLSYEMSFSDKSRLAVSWMHQSGHTSDDVLDPELVHPNLGNEELLFRFIHDIDERFRVGGTLKPYLGSDPGLVRFASDEFGEWYPWGTASAFGKPTPFIAAGLEQWGPDKVRLTSHVQLGAYIGNHLQPLYKPNVRVVAGYYNGMDPRFKYAQFKVLTDHFYYAGFEVGL